MNKKIFDISKVIIKKPVISSLESFLFEIINKSFLISEEIHKLVEDKYPMPIEIQNALEVKLKMSPIIRYVDYLKAVNSIPPSYEINLHNGRKFLIFYEDFSLMVKIEGREYYLMDMEERSNAIEHINRGGLAIPSTKDALEIINIFDPNLLSVKIYFEKNRSKLAEELAVDRLLSLIEICNSYNKGLVIDIDFKSRLENNKNHEEKEIIISGVETLINKDIRPKFWGIRKSGDQIFDETLIGLMNLENESNNKCILEYPHGEKDINTHSDLSLENFVLNGDFFLDVLIAWSTKQLSDEEAVKTMANKINQVQENIQDSNLTKTFSIE